MARLSRPYQIALAAVAVLTLVWVVALRGHSSGSPESISSSQPASGTSNAGSASAQSGSPGAASKVYRGATPGLEGLTRDIAKAHGAVATSEKSAADLQRSSAQASGQAATTGGAQANASRGAPQANASQGAPQASTSRSASQASSGRSSLGASRHTRGSASPSRRRAASGSHGASGASSSMSGRAPQQLQIEHEIERGKTVLLLFWEPRSTVDDAVRSQVLALGKGSKGRLAVHVALADQVGLFGPVTEVAHVYQTPTILIVGKHGVVTTLTGLVDKFSLQQAVREAQQANR